MTHPPLSLVVGQRWTSEELIEPISAGYVWSIDPPGPWLDVFIERAPSVPVTEGDMVIGAPCMVHLVLVGKAPGEGLVEAVCKRPWESEGTEDATYYRQHVVVAG